MFGTRNQGLTFTKNYTIAFFSPCGSDTSGVAKQFAEFAFKKDSSHTSLICEFPCLGVPRLAFEYEESFPKEQSIDQLLLDYERQSIDSADDYIVKEHDVHILPIFMKNKPDTPTIMKLQHNTTLMEIPAYIERELQGNYRFIHYVLQGQLIHPMTFFSIRQADVVVITINDSKELPWCYATYKKLIEDYGIKKEQIVMYSAQFIPEFREQPVLYKIGDLLKKVSEI